MSWLDNFRMPQKKNDFSITVHDADWDTKWNGIISSQVVSADVSLTEKRLTLKIRQLKSGAIQDVIFHTLNRNTRTIDHVILTPAKGKNYEYHFKNGEVTYHHTSFDYTSTDVIIHKLDLVFKEIELKSPNEGKMHSVKLGGSKKDVLMEG